MSTQLDIESFHRYCMKYQLPIYSQTLMIKAFKDQQPELIQGNIEYPWQKEGKWAFNFTCEGKKIKIELGNWPAINNVTFIGIEGMNM